MLHPLQRQITSTSLLSAAASGDQDARESLLGLAAEFTARLAESVIRKRKLPREDAEEVANDVIFKIHKALESGKYQPFSKDGRHKFHFFVVKVFNNAVLDRVRHLGNRAAINESSLAEDDFLAKVPDEQTEPMDQVIDQEGAEFAEAVCLTLAMQSIDMVRRKQTESKGDQNDAEQRPAAWAGFYLMVIEEEPREAVVQRITESLRAADKSSSWLNEDWLSNRATKLRRKLWRAFLDLAASFLPGDSPADLQRVLANMLRRVGYDDLAAAFRKVADPNGELCEEDLTCMDKLFATANGSINRNLPLKRLTEQLITRVTKISRQEDSRIDKGRPES